MVLLGLLTIRYFQPSAALGHTAQAFAKLLSWMCLKPNKTELWICTAHTPIGPAMPLTIYLPMLSYAPDDCVSLSTTHTHTQRTKMNIFLSIYLCVVHARIRSVIYGWFGLIEPLYILPFLTLHVATGWGARWAYAVAWWEIIWIIIA